MDLGVEIDHASVEKSAFDGELIPAGTEALAHITETDVVVPKSGKGKMLKCRWDILDGPFENRVIFDQINYQHSNPQAQLIGQQRIKAICEAIGHQGPLRNSDDIIFKPMRIKIGIGKSDDEYPRQNEIKSIKSADGRSASSKPGTPSAPTARTTASSAQNAGSADRPARAWGNRAR